MFLLYLSYICCKSYHVLTQTVPLYLAPLLLVKGGLPGDVTAIVHSVCYKISPNPLNAPFVQAQARCTSKAQVLQATAG